MIKAAVLAMALLGDQEDKEAAEAISKFKAEMKNPSTPARAAAVAELGRVLHQKTLNTIVIYLHQDTGEVRKAAAAALGAFIDYKKVALPQLLGAIGPNQKETMVLESIFLSVGKLGDEQKKRKSDLTPAVETALGKITGENFKTLREANDWWRKFKGSWKEPQE